MCGLLSFVINYILFHAFKTLLQEERRKVFQVTTGAQGPRELTSACETRSCPGATVPAPETHNRTQILPFLCSNRFSVEPCFSGA